MIKSFFLFFLVCILPIAPESTGEIVEFSTKDLSRESYFFSIHIESKDLLTKLEKESVSQKICKDKKRPDKCSFKIIKKEENALEMDFYFGEIPLFIVSGSVEWEKSSDDSLEINALLYSEIPLKKEAEIIVKGKNLTVPSYKFTPPPRRDEKENQPDILRTYPSGGVLGDTITLYGNYFGDNVDSIDIVFLDPKPDTTNPYDEKELEYARAFLLSTSGEIDTKTKKPLDILKFTLPHKLQDQLEPKWWEFITGKKIFFQVFSHHRPTEIKSIFILPAYWRLINFLNTIAILLGFWLVMRIITGKWMYATDVLIDPKTGTYKLANFQSFLWTITLFGCYFYVASAKMILLHDGELPEFPYSLTALLAISYTGLVTSNAIDSKRNFDLPKRTPRLLDLIESEDSKIDMAKLQLLGFTILGVIVYTANLLFGDALLGLVEIPTTFHTLLLGSQTGFIGAKLATKNEPTDATVENQSKS